MFLEVGANTCIGLGLKGTNKTRKAEEEVLGLSLDAGTCTGKWDGQRFFFRKSNPLAGQHQQPSRFLMLAEETSASFDAGDHKSNNFAFYHVASPPFSYLYCSLGR